MSIGSILNMARSGMNAQQTAVQIASQNIANAQTDGYSRKRVELTTAMSTVYPFGTLGTGVDVKTISRSRDALLDATYRTDSANQSAADTTASTLSQIQQVFGEPSDSGLSAALDTFWNSWSDLASDPTNGAAKAAVRSAGDNVASTLNRFAKQIDDIDQSNRESMNSDVNQINQTAKQVGELNQQIVAAEANGNVAGDLRDQRDLLLDKISTMTGGQVIERSNGSVGVYAAGRILVDGTMVKSLQMNDGQPPTVTFAGDTTPLTTMGGSLGAKIDISANRIPGVMAKLDSLAKQLVTTVNAIHSAGTTYSGTPAQPAAAGNFFDVTNPPPAGGDPLMTARGIKLAASLAGPDDVAAAGAGAPGPGDNSTASVLAALIGNPVSFTSSSGAAMGTASFSDFYSGAVGDVATQVQYAQDDATVQQTLVSNADQQRQSVSGVSTDDELISVIQHQHSYQAAARLVSVVDDMTQTLIDLGR